MTSFRIITACFGFAIIVVTVWQIAKGGVSRSNGKIPEQEDAWFGPE